MKSTVSYKRALAEIRSLRQRRRYVGALAAVDALLNQWPDQPALLVLRGELIQLQDEDGPPLDDVVAALKRAVALDDRNADAWLELGHFQFAVEDDAKAADKTFAQAVAASRATLIAALVGRAAALEEMGRKREAFDCLSVARYIQSAVATENGSAADESSLFDRWESLVGDANS
jgi:tetratricopeptide (TPR) repeat protein